MNRFLNGHIVMIKVLLFINGSTFTDLWGKIPWNKGLSSISILLSYYPASAIFKNCSNIKPPKKIYRNVFGVEWEKLDGSSLLFLPMEAIELFHTHQWQRLIWSHRGQAGSVDVHTQAETCRASQSGHYLVPITC